MKLITDPLGPGHARYLSVPVHVSVVSSSVVFQNYEAIAWSRSILGYNFGDKEWTEVIVKYTLLIMYIDLHNLLSFIWLSIVR